MTGDPILAWSEKLNRRVVIGVSAWDGREGLLPDRVTKPDYQMYIRGASAARDLPSRKEIGAGDGPVWVKCRCGRRMSHRAARCLRCRLADRRAA